VAQAYGRCILIKFVKETMGFFMEEPLDSLMGSFENLSTIYPLG